MKKLKLNKEAITSLNNSQMTTVNGGAKTIDPYVTKGVKCGVTVCDVLSKPIPR